MSEQRDVLYAVRRFGTCQVTLTILADSRPAAGRPCDFFRLGPTDSNGRVGGWARSRGSARPCAIRRGHAHGELEPEITFSEIATADGERTVFFESSRSLSIRLSETTDVRLR